MPQACVSSTSTGQHDLWKQAVFAQLEQGSLDINRQLLSYSASEHPDIITALIRKRANINVKDEVCTTIARTITCEDTHARS